MFNSQKINNDPETYVGWSGKRYSEESHTYATLEDGPVGEDPRPEYDNNPNLILERFRGTCEALTGGLCSTTQVEDELYLLGKADCAGLYEFTDRTLAHIDHARKVLEKLVNVYG